MWGKDNLEDASSKNKDNNKKSKEIKKVKSSKDNEKGKTEISNCRGGTTHHENVTSSH